MWRVQQGPQKVEAGQPLLLNLRNLERRPATGAGAGRCVHVASER